MSQNFEDAVALINRPPATPAPTSYKLTRSSGNKEYDSLYDQAGQSVGVDPDLLLEQGRVESVNFNPHWIYKSPNSKGYGGIAQLGEEEARSEGLVVDHARGIDERFVPEKAIPAQARFMKKLLDRHKGNVEAALASYVAGSGFNTQQALRVRERNGQARKYVDDITKAITPAYISGEAWNPSFHGGEVIEFPGKFLSGAWNGKPSEVRARKGDTLESLAARYNVPVNQIRMATKQYAPTADYTSAQSANIDEKQPSFEDATSQLQSPAAPATDTGVNAGLPAPTFEEPLATPSVNDGLQQEGQPATEPKPPAVRTPPMTVSIPEPPTPLSTPPFNQEMAGAYGTIMRKFSPAGIAAYHKFVKENYRPAKGGKGAKAQTVEQAAEDEGMASLFLKIQERLASDPTLTGKGRKVGQRQARALAEIGIDWLKDPAGKDSQLPPVLHAALIQSKMTPEEQAALPSLLRQQRASYQAQRAQARERLFEAQKRVKQTKRSLESAVTSSLAGAQASALNATLQAQLQSQQDEARTHGQWFRNALGIHQSTLFEKVKLSPAMKVVADLRSNVVQKSIEGYRQSKTVKSLTDELANLSNQQGPINAQQDAGRKKRISVIQSELQKTLPTGAYVPGIGTNLSPSARVNLKGLGLTDNEINKLAAAPPTHPYDARGFARGLQYYDPEKDQVRASLPNEAAKEEYDLAVSASRYDWIIRNSWSQLGGASKAALMRSLANAAAIQIENNKSSGRDAPSWLTKFEGDMRGKADAVSKGLERADDVAREVFGSFDPQQNSATAGPTLATRFIAQSLPALGEFLLAEKLGARSGQPGYAMGAYGALTTPEFSRQGIEQSVESAATYEKLGGSVFANLHKAGKIGGGILTGATTYAMARGEGASEEDALRAAFVFGFGSMLHAQGELKRTIEKGKQILEVAPEAARDVAGRLQVIATGKVGDFNIGDEVSYKTESGEVKTGEVHPAVGSDARHGVIIVGEDGTGEFVLNKNILGLKQKQLTGETAPPAESAPAPKVDETGAKIVGRGKAEDVKPASKMRIADESPLYKALRQLDEANQANEAENVKLFTKKARTQGATTEMIDEALDVDDARREAFFDSLKNIEPKESAIDAEQEIQSTAGQADQRDQGGVATSGSPTAGSGASGIRESGQRPEGRAPESASASAIEEGGKASNVPGASTPEVALSETSGRESPVSDKLSEKDVATSPEQAAWQQETQKQAGLYEKYAASSIKDLEDAGLQNAEDSQTIEREIAVHTKTLESNLEPDIREFITRILSEKQSKLEDLNREYKVIVRTLSTRRKGEIATPQTGDAQEGAISTEGMKAPDGKSYKVVWADGRAVKYFDNLEAANQFRNEKLKSAESDETIEPVLVDTPKGVRVESEVSALTSAVSAGESASNKLSQAPQLDEARYLARVKEDPDKVGLDEGEEIPSAQNSFATIEGELRANLKESEGLNDKLRTARLKTDQRTKIETQVENNEIRNDELVDFAGEYFGNEAQKYLGAVRRGEKYETEKNAASSEVAAPSSGASIQAGTGREATALDTAAREAGSEKAAQVPAPREPDTFENVSENQLDYGTIDKPHVPNLGSAFSKHFTAGNRFKNIVEARKFAGSLLKGDVKPGTLAAKQIDEAVELGAVRAAREIVRSGGSEKEVYNKLVDLYDRQPNLSMKTSTSVANQAYSTPLPLAYVASRLAGIDKDTSVYEPSAGNGALLIEAEGANVKANELDEQRANNLASLFPGRSITMKNGAEYRPVGDKVDAVIANPPFGVVKENGASKSFQVRPHYRTNEIDHAIALKALEAMKDNGRAVLIVGGVKAETNEGRSEGYNSKAKRAFYKTLYDEYNVIDHFTVAGDLYSKQGAAWPVDVIVIHGRGHSKLSLPAAEVPRTYKSFDQLAEVLNASDRTNLLDAGQPLADSAGVGRRGSSQRAAPDDGYLLDTAQSPSTDIDRQGESGGRTRLDDTRPPERDESVERATTELAGELGRGVDLAEPGDARAVADDGRAGQVAAPVRDEVNPESTTPVRDRNFGELSDRTPDAASQPAKIEEPPARVEAQKRERGKVATTSQQAPYSPVSRATPVGTFVPVNMKTATDDALDHLTEKVGDLDHFVAQELGYNPKEIPQYYSAEQVDAAAGAIQAMKDGSGYIIGDQGGIGKGRVVAAVIRWAHKTGRRAIFVTEKPNLYKDIVRDLVDINHGSMDEWATRALITNSNERIPLDDDETIVLKNLPSHNVRLQEMMARDDLGGYDTIFTTYSQMQTIQGGQRTVRQDFLQQFAPGSIIIFDESHNAGGTGSSKPTQNLDRAQFARQIAALADGVFYSSATYAKRPSVMSLYFKTDMRKAVPSIADLPEAIAKGGVPLQQVTAAMLTEAGQHIRRERNFAGLVYDTNVVPVDKRAAESVSEVMRNIKTFDELKAGAVERIAKEAKRYAKAVMADGSTGAAGASSTNFTSLMHNLIDQMLLTLKVDEAVSRALTSLEQGEKPVVTVANTMGSFIAHYVEDNGLHPGDAIGLNFGDMLRRYMERSREVIVGDAFGAKNRRYLKDDELGEQATQLYKNTLKLIERQDWSGMPVSPIDYIKQKLNAKGYKMGEITGRQHTIDYSSEMPVYRMRPSKETSIMGRTRTLTAFNGGNADHPLPKEDWLDALIINQAGSTGLSIHANARFADRRKRHMIIAQAERNIDTHMQMLYRVDRTGQVVKPSYEQLGADIPAEKRPMAVLSKKMASLNASTTASKESATKAKDTPDWMNDYGDEVVAALMEDNPDVHAALGRPLKDNQVGDGLARDGAIRKVTGRIPLLSIKDQNALYDMIESEYADMIERLDAMGENALEAKNLDLDAKPISQTEIFKGAEGDSSPFAKGAYAEEMDVKRIGKPYTSEQVTDLLARNLALPEGRAKTLENLQEAGRVKKQARGKDVRERYQEYKTSVLDDIEDPQKMRAKETQLDGVAYRLNSIFKSVHEGQTVQLEMNGGRFYGVVLNIEQKGQPKNPVALGSWKVTFAVSDAMKQITLPASRFHMEQDVKDKNELLSMGHVIVSPEAYAKTLAHGKIPVLEAFDKAQSVSRETRTIVTGNILAGFGKIPKGQIINFTDHEGNIRQGVLMPRDFDLQQALADEATRFTEPKHILDFLTQVNGLVSTKDQGLRVSNQHGSFRFSTAASKSTGGIYFLNRDLIDAAGQDFVKSGQYMILNLPRERAEQVLRAALEQGIEFQTQTYKDVARRITGNIVPQAENNPLWLEPEGGEGKSLGPGAAAAGDVNNKYAEASTMWHLIDSMKGQKKPSAFKDRLTLTMEALAKIPRKTDSAFARLSDRVNATSAALWQWYRYPPRVTAFKHAVGERELVLQLATAERTKFLQEFKRLVPSPIDDEAIQNYMDAGGREDVLKDWATRSTTEYKRGYERALQLTDAQKDLAKRLAAAYKAKGLEAEENGILNHFLNDYAARRWEGRNASVNSFLNQIAQGKMQVTFRHAMQRMIERSLDGEESGMKHITKRASILFADYDESLTEVIANRAFVRMVEKLKADDGFPILTPSGSGRIAKITREDAEGNKTTDEIVFINPRAVKKMRVAGVPEKMKAPPGTYNVVSHQALRKWLWLQDIEGKPTYIQGDLLVHKQYLGEFQAMTEKSALRKYAPLRFAFGVNSLIKAGRFALPFFHTTGIGLHAVFHLVNPLMPPEINWRNPVIRNLVRRGLNLAPDQRVLEQMKEGITAGKWVAKIPGIGSHILHPMAEWMWSSYFPRLNALIAQAALRRNLKRYAKQIRTGKYTRDQVYEFTAAQANKATDLINFRYLMRHPTTQDMLNLVLQSPHFTEARAGIVLDALKPHGREQLMMLLLMGATMYLGARVLNKIFDGDYHWKDLGDPFAVKIGGREFGIRTVAGDLIHMVNSIRGTDEGFFYNRLSPIADLTINEFSGRNYYGKKVSFGQNILDELKSITPFGLRDILTEDWWVSSLRAGGVSVKTHRSPAERLLNEYIGDHVPDSIEAPSEQTKVRRELLAKRQEKDITEDVQTAYNTGKIDEKTARELLRDEKLSSLAFKLKHVPVQVALDAYEKMTDAERTPDVKMAMVDTFAHNFNKLTVEDKERMKQLGFRVPRRFSPGMEDAPPEEPTPDRELRRQQAERERKAAREFAPGQELPTRARPALQTKKPGGFFYNVRPRQ